MKITKKPYNLQSLNFLKDTKLKIGVLGGSFDPPHLGHLLISEQAINLYKFDYIIWLVANQNPFKPKYKHDIFVRSKNACNIANHPKIIVSLAEYDLGNCYLYDTLKQLVTRFPNNDFSWLMGVDNKSHFHKWYRFEDIAKLCNIVIFDRPSPERFINNSKFDLKFKAMLASCQTNNIILCKRKMQNISSSQIKFFQGR